MPENKSAGTSADNVRSEEKVIYERSSTDNKRERSYNKECRPKERDDDSIVGKPSHFSEEVTQTSVNKQSRICGPNILNKFIFSVIFYMHE